MSGEDRSGTPPKTPEKTAFSENGAAKCGAVVPDAAIGAENAPELSLVNEAWPSLSKEFRLIIINIIEIGLGIRNSEIDASISADGMDRR